MSGDEWCVVVVMVAMSGVVVVMVAMSGVVVVMSGGGDEWCG
ncbi:hypothetical protein Tco_0248798, partial [Tanacetum coccineum]